MIFHRKAPKEPPLIEAMLENDLKGVKKWSDKAKEPNWLNYTPIEIAQYLNKQDALDILLPNRREKTFSIKGLGEMNRSCFEEVFGVRYLSHLLFPDYESFIKTVKSCPWLYRKTFLGNKMRRLAKSIPFELYTGYMGKVEIQWIGDEVGYGLFALEDLDESAFIAEYTGVVSFIDFLHGPENPYLLKYPKPFFSLNFLQVDSEKMGNETRFINHSYTPNLKTGIALDRGILHALFAARYAIAKGTQLTFNYGRGYWKGKEKPKRLESN